MLGPTLWIELWVGPYLLDHVIELAGQMHVVRRITCPRGVGNGAVAGTLNGGRASAKIGR
jgi:hypothetical protein